MIAIKWQPTCCGEHGEYAEHPMLDGGTARLKRSRGVGNWTVCRFGADNVGIDVDGDGVPDYVEMTEAETLALLA